MRHAILGFGALGGGLILGRELMVRAEFKAILADFGGSLPMMTDLAVNGPLIPLLLALAALALLAGAAVARSRTWAWATAFLSAGLGSQVVLAAFYWPALRAFAETVR